MNQIIDEAYEKYLKHTIIGIELGFDAIKGYLDGCLVEYDGHYEHFTNPSFAYGFRTHKKEEFIKKCKTDTEFSEKWGLQIKETYDLISYTEYFGDATITKPIRRNKLIIVYKGEITEIYE